MSITHFPPEYYCRFANSKYQKTLEALALDVLHISLRIFKRT